VDSAWLKRWSGLASEYAVAQAATQGLGVAAGLVLVNVMPVREYALYALALSVLTFVSIASELGISNALLYFRRETRVAAASFTPYVVAALRMRRALMAAAFAAAAAFLWHAASGNGFAALEIAATLAAALVALYFQIQASINLLLLRLAQAYRASYVAETLGNAGRLLGAIAMGVASLATAPAGVALGAVGALLTALWGKRALRPLAGDAEAPVEPAHYRRIARYVLPMVASTLYFAFQAPLMVWLSSHFGSAENIAEVGALGRLSILFAVVLGFVPTVVLPRLAGVTDDRLYLRRCLVCWGVLVPAGIAMLAAAAALPHWLLWPLGANYAGLERELLLVVFTSVLMLWGNFAVAVNNARGWVRWQSAVLVPYVALQVGLVAHLDLSSTFGVLLFGLWSALAGLVLHAAIHVLGFSRPQSVAIERARGAEQATDRAAGADA
jgi:O-antigen/teichoic acid export membrane protein